MTPLELVGGAVAIISCGVGLATYLAATKARSKHEGAIEQALTTVANEIKGMREDMKRTEERLEKQNERLIIVQRDLKTAFFRIDEQRNLLDRTVALINSIEKRCAAMHGYERSVNCEKVVQVKNITG